MINKFLADIRIIKDAINTKKLVIFAGAGISIDAGVPSWGKLIDEIKNDLDLPKNESDYLKIPQIYYNERQEKEYIEKIRDVLSHKKLKHNEIHEEIFHLEPEHILTTNFEDLLEQVINKKSLPFSIVRQDTDLPYSHNTKLLVKIHGDLDNTNFVLKEDDYLNYSHNHPLIEAFIKSIFATKVVLFIGYSYSDFNLKQIIQNVRNILGNNFQNAYLLSTDNQAHFSQKQYLKNKGINVIDYYDATSNNGKNYIEGFLKGQNIYSKIYFKEINSLSEKGQLLFNLLKFIRFYDESKITITEENAVEQIYQSLDRFSELKSLPQEFVSRLYPFKSSDEEEYLIHNNTLLLKNDIIVNLFYNEIVIEGDKVVYKPLEKLSERERSEKEKKLGKIVKKLNNSIIYYVTKEKEKASPHKYKGISDESKSISLKSEKKCGCTKCKFERYEFNDFLYELNSYTINEISGIKEDMQMAYLNYKIGNFLYAFKMYEEIASKAWYLGKYITYYIAKKNMNKLKWQIKYRQNNITKEEKDKIMAKIAEIDTDKLIFQIPQRSNEEFELLKMIRDDKVLYDVKEEIEELYKKVEKVYTNYKNKYYYEVGPYYPQQIYIQLYKMIIFYSENYIIGDNSKNFKSVIQKGIEALILSYSTDKSYSGRLSKFSDGFFDIVITYCDSASFLDFLEKHEIASIEFDDEGLDEIITNCNNYFTSFFSENKFAIANSLVNELIFYQLKHDFFNIKMRSVFNNIMLLLLSVDIPEEKMDFLIGNLITFLEYENFVTDSGLKSLNRFIKKNAKNFSIENSKRLLKILHNKIKKYEQSNTFETIAYLANENKFELLDDERYAIKILSDFEYYDSKSGVIVSLWQISDKTIKNQLQVLLIDRLNTSFDVKLYTNASYAKMIDFNLFFDDYIDYLNISPQSNYVLENGRPKFDSFHSFNVILFLFFMDVKPNDPRLKRLQNLNDFMSFFIFRDKSDLKKFKIEWLLLMPRKIIYEKLSKIKALKKIIEDSLKNHYDSDVAKIYTEYFL
ncbi:SIR2 family protein [Flavobacterium sp. HJSW_4]|uniref:SIR2 family protein n=1 Tax=Flavobacterium sp. HJSW_4 TaxID=3344660 RepID=UPI0035F35430